MGSGCNPLKFTAANKPVLRLLLFTKRKTQPTLDRAVNKNRKSALGRAKADKHTFSEISPSDNAELVSIIEG